MEYMSSTSPYPPNVNDSSSSSTSVPLIPLQHQQWPLQISPVPTTGTGLEEAMWMMSLNGPSDGSSMEPRIYYPERPGEPDCTFYMRTGACGFGANCKFNHPPGRLLQFVANHGRGEYPERQGQPECQYYLKTGTCKFGASCKYHHPPDKAGTTGGPQLNALNLPMRPDEKDCAYYLRTGSCKYGTTCKFNHPLPMPVPVPVSGSTTIVPTQIPHLYSGVSGWPMSTRPSFFPPPRLSGPSNFTPFLFPSPHVPMPSWNPYQVPFAIQDGQQQAMPQGSYIYSPTPQEHVAIGVFPPPLVAGSGSMRFPTPPNAPHNDIPYPERPGQPECQYYMRTGECKYGSQCKYHHPKERNTSAHSNFYRSTTSFTPRSVFDQSPGDEIG